MDITQQGIVLFGTILMVAALIVSFIPILPGTVIVWIAAIAIGFITTWSRFTPAAGIAATAIMIFSVSSDFWLPALGIKTGGLTCLGAIGSLVGGLIATFLIPIPLCGTLIGAVIGALVFEMIHFRNMQKALQAGQSAATMFVLGYIVESASSIAVFVVYLVSLATTGSG
ncbi:MAG: DUF456 domain-containing protein [Chloroflexota bacterium]